MAASSSKGSGSRKRFHADEAGPSTSRSPPQTRSKRRVSSTDELLAEVPMPEGWSALPLDALSEVFLYLENQDVISAGQTCRTWRVVAKMPSVWRRRVLSYDLPGRKDWHAGAAAFVRTLRFAPCLARVRCAKSLKGGARAAISNAKCEIRSAELNGQLQWILKFVLRQKTTLQDLTLLNPKLEALQESLKLPNLVSMSVAYERDRTQEKYQRSYYPGMRQKRFKVPAVPKGTKGKLRKLICHPGVGDAAAESLVLANAATVEEVGVHSLPVAALQQCAKLRRLMVKVDPAKAADRDRLRQLLEKRAAPLEYLAFLGSRSHAKAACAELRASLRHRVSGRSVVCSACDGVCALETPRFASREEDDYDSPEGFGPFDFLANMFRGSGPCMCLSCCQDEAEYGDYDDEYGYVGFEDEDYDQYY